MTDPSSFSEEFPTSKKSESIILYESLILLFDSLTPNDRLEIIEIITNLRELGAKERKFISSTIEFLRARRT